MNPDEKRHRDENQPPCSWWIKRLYREPTPDEIAAAQRARAEARRVMARETTTGGRR